MERNNIYAKRHICLQSIHIPSYWTPAKKGEVIWLLQSLVATCIPHLTSS